MWQLIVRGLVVAVLRRIFVVIAAPFVVIVATPIIFLRASILARRKEQNFKFALLDGYDSVWELLVVAFMWPFYGDMDRIEAARRRSSNQIAGGNASRGDTHV
jgi:hypothetical protein